MEFLEVALPSHRGTRILAYILLYNNRSTRRCSGSIGSYTNAASLLPQAGRQPMVGFRPSVTVAKCTWLSNTA